MKKNKRNFDIFHSQLDLPFLETDNKLIEEIFQTLESKFGLKKNSNQKMIDLGAGKGNIVIFSALHYGIKSYGIEIDNNLVKEAELRIQSFKKSRTFKQRLFKKIKIISSDFYLINLKKYDFIYIYSLPSMHKYLNHIFTTAKKEAIFISHKYKFDIFSSFLKNKFKLTHNKNKQEIFTFFYEKFL